MDALGSIFDNLIFLSAVGGADELGFSSSFSVWLFPPNKDPNGLSGCHGLVFNSIELCFNI